MRSVGYTLEAALADLIDNSISAGATAVEILFSTEPDDYVAVLDNGRGMGSDEARAAMQLAGSSPLDQRRDDDLGRFGLGLKTASLSQCRELTIVTIGDDGIVGLQWNLDRLLVTRRWSINVLDAPELEPLPGIRRLLAAGRGTLVLWRNLDALRAQVGDDAGLDAAMLRARDHLQLVFHRFLAGDHGRKFSIFLNGIALELVDPFLRGHKATAQGPEESFHVNGATVKIRPFTLPHLNKLSAKDRARAMVAGSLRDSQGFYVYRAMRLVIWGTWFRILPREEVAKLARVQVDIPNSLDHLWALDIKKSAAQPPPEVKRRLKRFADKMVIPSKRTYSYRGRPAEDTVQRMWTLVEDRDNFRYEINRSHPGIAALAECLDQSSIAVFTQVLAQLERSFPIDDAFNRIAQDKRSAHAPAGTSEDIDFARNLWEVFRQSDPDPEAFVQMMRTVEPFGTLPDGLELLRKATS